MSLQHQLIGHCACPMCSGDFEFEAVDVTETAGSLDPQSAPTFTDAQVINQIDSGYKWSGSQISYGFLNSGPSWANGEQTGFVAFNAQQKAATREIMELWDELIAVDLVETGSNPASADVNFGNTNTNISYAHAYYPNEYYDIGGSVWLNAPTYSGLYAPDYGDYYWLTIIHEVGHALGLSHPGAYNGGAPSYANDAEYAQDTRQWSVMSYFSASHTGADNNGGTGWKYAQTPMVHDILTIQSIYGADTTTRTGDTTYGFNSNAGKEIFDFSQNSAPVLTIYDTGGIDTLDLSGFSQRAIIDLTPGSYSSVGGVSNTMTNNLGIAHNTWIENAIGGSGNDTIRGNNLNNILDGNGGTDTAVFSGALTEYTLVEFGGIVAVLTGNGDGIDQLLDFEQIQFADQTVGTESAAKFDGLAYIASYGDLIAAFGADAQTGFEHYLSNGYGEGRTVDLFDARLYLGAYDDLRSIYGSDLEAATTHFITTGFAEGRSRDAFNGYEYIASYGDLIAAFGENAAAGINHFMENGFDEGRSISFDGLDYIAGYDDLIQAFGANSEAGAHHFIVNGMGEGRSTDPFDARLYLGAYDDLRSIYGSDLEAATTHFITTGFAEGRSRDAFNGYEYIASYSDLIVGIGEDAAAGVTHFLETGFDQGRSVLFDGLDYIASYDDLIQAFGANSEAGAHHFIVNGMGEGRSTDPFDARLYLGAYDDLRSIYGSDLEAATNHFITTGFAEGRDRDAFNGFKYIASYDDLISAFGENAAAGVNHFLESGFDEGRSITFDAEQYLANYSDLQAAFGDNTEAAAWHFIAFGYDEGRTDELIV
ncbi:M10 family metallopeptidase [Hoeflea poritis]|uniref:M10 family metallopeptidase n=1 Tax=Hoeflea poritis TaxID=2993659 RepID=A0ABT4VNI1_9HYPH|nr:M10 family metallopeptidase [Hoeflea poritis]MDA4846239.1 M10 family metallopeptidase [Hoeflea poritis]